jgi:hypothetical protein
MEWTETPALRRKPPGTEIPIPVAAAPAPYSADRPAVIEAETILAHHVDGG